MAELMIQRTLGNTLKACYPSDVGKIQKLKVGEFYACKIVKPRNLKHHRKFFTLIRLVFQNLPEGMEAMFKSDKDVLNEFKLQTGHYTKHNTLGGKVTYIPSSISFAAMNQDDFDVFYDRCIDIAIKYFFDGLGRKALKDEVINNY